MCCIALTSFTYPPQHISPVPDLSQRWTSCQSADWHEPFRRNRREKHRLRLIEMAPARQGAAALGIPAMKNASRIRLVASPPTPPTPYSDLHSRPTQN